MTGTIWVSHTGACCGGISGERMKPAYDDLRNRVKSWMVVIDEPLLKPSPPAALSLSSFLIVSGPFGNLSIPPSEGAVSSLRVHRCKSWC
jgi:hypothetical protein